MDHVKVLPTRTIRKRTGVRAPSDFTADPSAPPPTPARTPMRKRTRNSNEIFLTTSSVANLVSQGFVECFPTLLFYILLISNCKFKGTSWCLRNSSFTTITFNVSYTITNDRCHHFWSKLILFNNTCYFFFWPCVITTIINCSLANDSYKCLFFGKVFLTSSKNFTIVQSS